MSRRRTAVIGQSTKVDDALDARAGRRWPEVAGGLTINRREIRSACHRMYQVVCGPDAGQRAIERRLIEAVTLDDLRARTDRTEPCRVPHETPDGASVLFESSKKPSADVSSGA